MKRNWILVGWFVIAWWSVCRAGVASEMRRADSILLNGRWQYAVGEGTEPVPAGETAALRWHEVTLPGQFPGLDDRRAADIRCVWIRRTFKVTAAQAARLAVLRWNRIDYGATAFVNGRKVGHNDPTGPYFVLLKAGTLRAGANEKNTQTPKHSVFEKS